MIFIIIVLYGVLDPVAGCRGSDLAFLARPTKGRYHTYMMTMIPGHTWWFDWLPRYSPQPPEQLSNEEWSTSLSAQQLGNMTKEIVKDVMTKLGMLRKLHGTSFESAEFKVAQLMAKTMQRFKTLVDIYKYHSAYEKFSIRGNQSITELMLGYQRMQSDFMQIQIEKENYFKHEMEYERNRTEQLERVRNRKLQGLYSSRPIRIGMSVAEWEALTEEQRTKLLQDEKTFRKSTTRRDSEESEEWWKIIRNQQKPAQYLHRRSGVMVTNKTVAKAEEEYKRGLRYVKWFKKWQGFDPKIEGIDIKDSIARVGYLNASSFKEFNVL